MYKRQLYHTASQAYAFYLPVKSVGVVGDNRIYADVIGLRSVNTTDFMTAKATALPHDFVEHVSTRIVNEIDGMIVHKTITVEAIKIYSK